MTESRLLELASFTDIAGNRTPVGKPPELAFLYGIRRKWNAS